ncbi:diheme cytochrome c [Rubrivivax gelatinosus]|uniref:Diheme cytochrome c n=1 Tax=Rubrivivax gelatinosus TaxID=28068 RepID=A0A4R2M405_RUBGE|nr:diheme cytochrome c [Rubrivivax gelatinosus]MBK1689590.1 cytochrome C [Rubrivivax gelatinosus]TCP01262.1 diheme cytochrome c [Rubrivivax gelatinosus]
MKRLLSTRGIALATAALLVAGLAGGAAAWAHRHGDEEHERHERREHGDRDGRRAAVAALPAYEQECGGSCHVAYPPGMLPAESWKRVMAGLDQHYGSDASLDAATQKTIAAWLDTHASRRTRSTPPEDRITRSAWFERKHDELRASVWQRKAVGSPANCAACHPRAEQGDFEEHDVKIPK